MALEQCHANCSSVTFSRDHPQCFFSVGICFCFQCILLFLSVEVFTLWEFGPMFSLYSAVCQWNLLMPVVITQQFPEDLHFLGRHESHFLVLLVSVAFVKG